MSFLPGNEMKKRGDFALNIESLFKNCHVY